MARSTAPARRRAPMRSTLRPGGLRAERAARLTHGCAACGSDRLTEISMTLTDGSQVRFRSCQVCEHRTWSDAEEDVLSLAGVLTRTRKPR
ncbi:MAG: hypothetical protein ACXV5Q_09405 [Frankiaceae bacterium]